GPAAQLAADALVLVHQHDPVLGALVAGAGGAHGDAGRGLAVQARAREVQGHGRLRFAAALRWTGRELVAVHAVEPDPGGLPAVWLLVHQRAQDPARVPLLAAGRAGVAAHAGVQVDHQAELPGWRWRQGGHGWKGKKRGMRMMAEIQKITLSGMPTFTKSLKR